MEHEVFVPVPADRLQQVLSDPEQVAGAVPGLQRDADESASPLSGRLKVRVGGHTITYRGAARVASRGDGSFAIEGEGVEVRGGGSVKLSLVVRLDPAEDGEGTQVVFSGTGAGEGRVAESSPQAVEGAVRRLLERFAEGLGRGAEEPEPEAEPVVVEPVEDVSVFETDVPPSSFDEAEEEILVPPAEAAHARRTMIGRSAEEVDHAPPRGRYAPAPAAESMSTSATLRWAAPAAAVVLASAIVVGRALRRRR
ncbi:SRPBCC domain-containing protein [Streptomyces durmitorensis]|uniref:SRPBCC domain-containing protein n=1 Tax=Streptomyces durmitorensis TaxID=319947 RepID=A0ABY4PWF2_9ACTN|nr:SRPBCC domain-containing protein [Streptomyces durmitorensis]UQT57342.1 SRPBCC domain-containing protein [Streptomyces durmitorensis]